MNFREQIPHFFYYYFFVCRVSTDFVRSKFSKLHRFTLSGFGGDRGERNQLCYRLQILGGKFVDVREGVCIVFMWLLIYRIAEKMYLVILKNRISFGICIIFNLSVYGILLSIEGILNLILHNYPLFTGPIVASLSARFGHRPVVIAGAVISALGFFASCFVTSVYALIAFVGAVSGKFTFYYGM